MHAHKRHITHCFLLIITFTYFHVSPSEGETPQKTKHREPSYTHLIPNINTRGVPLDAFPYIKTYITPDEKTVIISYNGGVYKNSIASHFSPRDTSSALSLLFKHTSARLTSHLTTDITRDGSLLIVSGGNYYNKKAKQLKSEIITYNSNDQSHTFQEYNGPLQTLKLSHRGTLLIGATPSHMLLFNRENGAHYSSEFNSPSKYLPDNTNNNEKIVDADIAFDPNLIANNYVIFLGERGTIQLMKINPEQTALTFAKRIMIANNLTQLTLPTCRAMLYATEKSKVKIIDMFDFINEVGNYHGTLFSHSVLYEQVTLDQFSQTTAHWTSNQDMTDSERSIILVNRITNPKNPTHPDPEEDKIEPNKEHYRLSAKFDEKSYPIILPNGKTDLRKSHFLTVEVRGSTVVAIISTGEECIWHLPPLPKAHNSGNNTIVLDTIHTRSSSSNDTITTTTTITTTPETTPIESPMLNRGNKNKFISLPAIPHRSRSNSASPRTPSSGSPINSSRGSSKGSSKNNSPQYSPKDKDQDREQGRQFLNNSDSKPVLKKTRRLSSSLYDSEGSGK